MLQYCSNGLSWISGGVCLLLWSSFGGKAKGVLVSGWHSVISCQPDASSAVFLPYFWSLSFHVQC